MFPATAFAPRYYAKRYWPKVGATIVVIGGVTADRTTVIPFESRATLVPTESRSTVVPPEIRRVNVR